MFISFIHFIAHCSKNLKSLYRIKRSSFSFLNWVGKRKRVLCSHAFSTIAGKHHELWFFIFFWPVTSCGDGSFLRGWARFNAEANPLRWYIQKPSYKIFINVASLAFSGDLRWTLAALTFARGGTDTRLLTYCYTYSSSLDHAVLIQQLPEGSLWR